jgi:hypothetical protein
VIVNAECPVVPAPQTPRTGTPTCHKHNSLFSVCNSVTDHAITYLSGSYLFTLS